MNFIFQKGQVETELSNILNAQYTSDQNYVMDTLKEALKFLADHNVRDVPDFCSILHDFGFKSEEIAVCFKKFVRNYNDNHETQKIIWFKPRSFRTLKYYNRNFIIARLVYEHGRLLFEYLRNYISNKLNNEEKISQFINEMNLNFDKIKTGLNIENVDIDLSDLFNDNDNDTNELYEIDGNEDFDIFGYI